jgi:hypothetical protein
LPRKLSPSLLDRLANEPDRFRQPLDDHLIGKPEHPIAEPLKPTIPPRIHGPEREREWYPLSCSTINFTAGARRSTIRALRRQQNTPPPWRTR